MARPIKIRKLITPHKEIIFRPIGNMNSGKEIVTLLSEEYEVLKLIDYEGMHQQQASRIMGISRPTITRIYEKARKKLSECLIELKELRVEGGNSIPGDIWYKCKNCESMFNIPPDTQFEKNCPVCLTSLIDKL
jgi:uncharacterized protein